MARIATAKEEKVAPKKNSDGEKGLMSLFGEDALFLDGDIGSVGTYDVIRTGSPSLDYALGIGGIPRGRIIQLAGKESSGKTLISLLCMKTWLNEHPENTVMFIDAEFTYDPRWAKDLGVDTSRVVVVKTNDAKKIFEGLVGRMKVNQITKKSSKDVKGVLDLVLEGEDPRFKRLGLIVLDSVAAMQTPMEADAIVGKQNMAPMSRFLTTELKKLTPALAEANVAMIFINQIRENPGDPSGGMMTSGGHALKHACSVMINVNPMGGADNIVLDDNDQKIGHKAKAKVAKNKVGPPYRESIYTIKYTEGLIDREEELLDLAVLCGVIIRPNNVSYMINGEKVVGKGKAAEFLHNKAKFSEVEEACRTIYLAGAVAGSFTPSEDEEQEDNDLISEVE